MRTFPSGTQERLFYFVLRRGYHRNLQILVEIAKRFGEEWTGRVICKIHVVFFAQCGGDL